jgi:Uma2 family endonuclease
MYTPVGIDLPEYYEWVRGTAYPKVSPGKPHGRLQVEMAVIVHAWGRKRGMIAAENDMNIRAADDDIRRYLPDIQFTSYERLDAHRIPDDVEIHYIAPDLVIEVVSPQQPPAYFEEKIRAFLVAGTAVVLVVDPDRQAFLVHRVGSRNVLARGDRFEDPAFPGLVIDVAAVFDALTCR